MKSNNSNIAIYLRLAAEQSPKKKATVLHNGVSINFAQLDRECDRFVDSFAAQGIVEGTRVATFVKPSLDFVPIVFALFKMGAVPVFIDPGMKPTSMTRCLEEVEPQAAIFIPRALVLGLFAPGLFRSIRTKFVLGLNIPGCHFLRPVEPLSSQSLNTVPKPAKKKMPEDLAAILFTSGSTGVPKGVEYTHGQFDHQRMVLRSVYGIGKDEIDLVAFPPFALFSAAWGITAIIPKFNPGKPARVNGRELAELIQREQVTHTAGSPAIWKRLADECIARELSLSSIRRILMAGAPVSEKIIRNVLSTLSNNAIIYTPYGATEALPLTNISHKELFQIGFNRTRKGQGTCIGHPVGEVTLATIPTTDLEISTDQVVPLGPNVIGEIVVKGPIVTKRYFNRPQATRMAKIVEGKTLWHRMGDLGYFDEEGRLWFCGRKDHRVQTKKGLLFPVAIEGIFNQHPHVVRTAVVSVKKSEAALVIEAKPNISLKRLKSELIEIAKSSRNTDAQTVKHFIFKNRFPVDVRHNIKIDRRELSLFADQQLHSQEAR